MRLIERNRMKGRGKMMKWNSAGIEEGENNASGKGVKGFIEGRR